MWEHHQDSYQLFLMIEKLLDQTIWTKKKHMFMIVRFIWTLMDHGFRVGGDSGVHWRGQSPVNKYSILCILEYDIQR